MKRNGVSPRRKISCFVTYYHNHEIRAENLKIKRHSNKGHFVDYFKKKDKMQKQYCNCLFITDPDWTSRLIKYSPRFSIFSVRGCQVARTILEAYSYGQLKKTNKINFGNVVPFQQFAHFLWILMTWWRVKLWRISRFEILLAFH